MATISKLGTRTWLLLRWTPRFALLLLVLSVALVLAVSATSGGSVQATAGATLIVDQGALGQYNQNHYLYYDAFDFHGEYQGNNAQALIPIPDPTDTISLPNTFPVLGNVFTIEAQVYSAAHENMPHRTIIGNDANPANNERDRPTQRPVITGHRLMCPSTGPRSSADPY